MLQNTKTSKYPAGRPDAGWRALQRLKQGSDCLGSRPRWGVGCCPQAWLHATCASPGGQPGCVILMRTKVSHMTKTRVKGKTPQRQRAGTPRSQSRSVSTDEAEGLGSPTRCQPFKSKAAGPGGGTCQPDMSPAGGLDLAWPQPQVGQARTCCACEKPSGGQGALWEEVRLGAGQTKTAILHLQYGHSGSRDCVPTSGIAGEGKQATSHVVPPYKVTLEATSFQKKEDEEESIHIRLCVGGKKSAESLGCLCYCNRI